MDELEIRARALFTLFKSISLRKAKLVFDIDEFYSENPDMDPALTGLIREYIRTDNEFMIVVSEILGVMKEILRVSRDAMSHNLEKTRK